MEMDRMISPPAALNECMNRTCDNFHSLHDHQQTSVDRLDGHAMWKPKCENFLHEKVSECRDAVCVTFIVSLTSNSHTKQTRLSRERREANAEVDSIKKKISSRLCRLKSDFGRTFISIESD